MASAQTDIPPNGPAYLQEEIATIAITTFALAKLALASPALSRPGLPLLRVIAPVPPQLASEVVGKLMEAGMLTVPAGQRVVRFVPPLVVTEAEVDAALSMVGEALEKLKK